MSQSSTFLLRLGHNHYVHGAFLLFGPFVTLIDGVVHRINHKNLFLIDVPASLELNILQPVDTTNCKVCFSSQISGKIGLSVLPRGLRVRTRVASS